MTVIGAQRGTFLDPERTDWAGAGPRPIAWRAWYPAADSTPEPEVVPPPGDALFTSEPVVDGARLSAIKDRWPIVLLSHGTGGQAEGLSWLGARLARAGYVCLAVSHHGNSSIEPYLAEGFICWWERPRDLTEALDQFVAIPGFAGRIDLEAVFAIGFSLGGYTVLSLAGAITNLALFQDWLSTQPDPSGGPREFPDLAERFDELQRSSEVFRASLARQSNCYRDSRVRAITGLAPAPPVRGLTPESVAEIAVPVSLMVGQADIEAPPDVCAVWLTERNSRFSLNLLGETVGHYVFLNEATAYGRDLEPEICVDPPGVNRRAIHDRAAELADRTFRSAMEATL